METTMDIHAFDPAETLALCANELNQDRRRQLSGTDGTDYTRRPDCPLLNVFWEGLPEAGQKLIRQVFSDHWPVQTGNVTYVAFLEGSIKSGELAKSLARGAAPLRQNNAIPNRGRAFVAHYLCLSSKNFQKQLKAIQKTHSEKIDGFLQEVYPLVFLFCDLDITETGQMKEMIRKTHHELQPVPNLRLICLCNELYDNSLLPFDETGNFRIAADVALLASTTPDGNNEPNGLRGWLASGAPRFGTTPPVKDDQEAVTAAYLLMQKPCRRIASVILRELIDQRRKLAKDTNDAKRAKQIHNSETQFFSAAGITVQSIPCLDKAFDAYIKPDLPDEASFTPLVNWQRVSRRTSYDEANRITCGALELFVERYFCFNSSQITSEICTAICREFISSLLDKTDYLFARDYFRPLANALDRVCPGGGGSIYETAVAKAKRSFYQYMIPQLKDAMCACADEAESFCAQLDSFYEAFYLPPEPVQAGLTSTADYYGKRAETYASSHSETLQNALRPCGPSLGEGLLSVFKDLTGGAPDVFSTTLEEELALRTQTDGSGKAPDISTALDSDLSKKQRIFPGSFKFSQAQKSFYLFYGGAQFGNRLKEKTGRVTTKCLNQAERLVLYKFKPEEL